jgi:hypothetical protein
MYVCAAHKVLDISSFNRLYAYPNIPLLDDNHRIILDSGAFGLSKSGRSMDESHIAKLAKHYETYGKKANVFCIAPDVFKNATLSMRQYKDFIAKYEKIKIVPVIQFVSSYIDFFSIKKQVTAYQKITNSRMICISNNKFDPVKQFKELKFIVDEIKRKNGDILIHVLGAGYSHNNVKDWMEIGVDSIDSISYYTDAQAGLEWIAGSYKTNSSTLRFHDLAIRNAEVANFEILH